MSPEREKMIRGMWESRSVIREQMARAFKAGEHSDGVIHTPTEPLMASWPPDPTTSIEILQFYWRAEYSFLEKATFWTVCCEGVCVYKGGVLGRDAP